MHYLTVWIVIVLTKTLLCQEKPTNEDIEIFMEIYGFTIKNCTQTLNEPYLEWIKKLDNLQRTNAQPFLIPQSFLKGCVLSNDFDNKFWPEITDIKIASSGGVDLQRKNPQLGIVFEELIDLNFNGDIYVKTMFVFEWTDLRLRWRTNTSFTNWKFHSMLNVPSKEIYSLPMLRLENCHQEPCTIKADSTIARIRHTGQVRLAIERQIQATCDEDMTYFPFDMQECGLQFKSLDVNFEFLNKGSPVIFALFTENAEWFISKVKYDSGGCLRYPVLLVNISGEYNYTQYIHKFKDQRRAAANRECLNMIVTAIRVTNFYWSNLMTPLLVVVFVSLLTIVYPAGSDEKVNVLLTLLLSYIMFQSILSNIMPKTRSDPLILTYIISTICLCALDLLFTFITMHIKELNHSLCKPPRIIKLVLICWARFKMLLSYRFCHSQMMASKTESETTNNMDPVLENENFSGDRIENMQQTNEQENLDCPEGWDALAELLNVIFNLIFIVLNFAVFNIYMLPILTQWVQNSYAPSYFGNHDNKL